MKQQALEAFRETIAVFIEQVGVSELGQQRAAPHELLRYGMFLSTAAVLLRQIGWYALLVIFLHLISPRLQKA